MLDVTYFFFPDLLLKYHWSFLHSSHWTFFQCCLTPFAHFCLALYLLYLPFTFTVRFASGLMAHCMFEPRINCTKVGGKDPFTTTIAIDYFFSLKWSREITLGSILQWQGATHTSNSHWLSSSPQILAMSRAEHEPNHLEVQKALNLNVFSICPFGIGKITFGL